ncbi:MAG TPA: T9SS type A sorting domain-containing protein, partial [Flavobacteriales bacterium]|nr:T9SS type A sorting domain-containing protein [Flavobacteriales bacterium]
TITDANGCVSSKSAVVYNGGQELEPALGVRVYPIPSRGKFNVVLTLNRKEPVSLQLFNLLGETVIYKDLGFQAGVIKNIVDISSAQSGIYFLVIKTGETFQVKKIVKN